VVIGTGMTKLRNTSRVPACGLQHVRFRQRQHQIGGTKLPSAGKRRRLGRVARIPLGRAALDPLRDERDLIIAEPSFADELAVSGLWQPRRHRASLHG
jgi:hypothetical protein